MAGFRLTLHSILCHTILQFATTCVGEGFDWCSIGQKTEWRQEPERLSAVACATWPTPDLRLMAFRTCCPAARAITNTVRTSGMNHRKLFTSLTVKSAAFARALAQPPHFPPPVALFSQPVRPAWRSHALSKLLLSARTGVTVLESPTPSNASPLRPYTYLIHPSPVPRLPGHACGPDRPRPASSSPRRRNGP